MKLKGSLAPEKKKEKLFSVSIHDCVVETFRAGGPGGQNQNKVESGVRIKHRPSGAVAESRKFRSQLENRREAFMKMGKSPEFQKWARIEAAKRIRPKEKTVEERVAEQLAPEKILIEEYQQGKWVPMRDRKGDQHV